MTTAHYNYDVRISYGSDILKSGPFSESFANCGEMLITSKPYNEYAGCERALNGLMSSLSYLEAKLSDKNFVIVTKVNPILDASGKRKLDADAETWDKHTVMRAYIADAKALKDTNLTYHVLGQIKVDQTLLGIKKPETKLEIKTPGK